MKTALRMMAIAAGALAMAVSRAESQSATSPHGPLRKSCATCHRADGWKPVRVSAGFRHSPGTFPLEAAHATATCTSCHRRLDFQATPRACASCHEDVHKGELGADCARCHSARSFIDPPAMVRAHEATRFPLRGQHAAAPCESCHPASASGAMRFVNRPTMCFGCHAALYAAARPDHRAFPTDCASCHNSSRWAGAAYNHALTRFPLTGAHLAVSCAGCHGNGVYRGTSTDCYSCHQSDYAATANPNHAAASFSTTCASCHTTANWLGATFNHDANWFPIYSGKHRGRWSTCTQCHTSASDYRQFTCLTCHEHNQTKMDDEHRGRSGYRYESLLCYACHPHP